MLRLPDHPGQGGDGARGADPAARAGARRRRARDGYAVPSLPSFPRRLAIEAGEVDRTTSRHADPAPVAADRCGGGPRRIGAQVQAPRRSGGAARREADRLTGVWIGIGLGVAVVACLVWGWLEAGWVRLRTMRVELERLPPELGGLRIAHLSDFHLGLPSRGTRAVRKAV